MHSPIDIIFRTICSLLNKLNRTKYLHTYSVVFRSIRGGGGGGVLPGILGGGVPPGSSNPDPISDLNMPFSIPVFRPDL